MGNSFSKGTPLTHPPDERMSQFEAPSAEPESPQNKKGTRTGSYDGKRASQGAPSHSSPKVSGRAGSKLRRRTGESKKQKTGPRSGRYDEDSLRKITATLTQNASSARN
jgi:hypothetical protein